MLQPEAIAVVTAVTDQTAAGKLPETIAHFFPINPGSPRTLTPCTRRTILPFFL